MQRIESIDIAKGIGIVLVVFGHLTGTAGSNPDWLVDFRGFIYQFHIPLFFYLSGIFFKPAESWKVFLCKRIKRLYIPYVVANLVFLICDILFRRLSGMDVLIVNEIKHAGKIVLGLSLSPMGGATWFLISLLKASIIYKIIFDIFREGRLCVIAVSIIIGVIGMFVTSEYTIGPSMLAVMYFCFGNQLSEISTKEVNSLSVVWKYSLLIASFLLLLFILPHNSMDISAGRYDNRLLAVAGSIFGIIMTMILSDLLKNSKAIKKSLCYIGSKTLNVLIGHFAAFKFVIIIQIFLSGAVISTILSHPCYDVSGFWSVLYLLSGIILPLIPSIISKYLKHAA